MTLREIILARGRFYHMTTLENWERIKEEGLKVECCTLRPEDLRNYLPAYRKPCVFLSTREQRNAWQRNLSYHRFRGKQLCILAISAERIVGKEIGPDLTHASTLKLLSEAKRLQLNDVETMNLILTELGSIACFEDIEADDIEMDDILAV